MDQVIGALDQAIAFEKRRPFLETVEMAVPEGTAVGPKVTKLRKRLVGMSAAAGFVLLAVGVLLGKFLFSGSRRSEKKESLSESSRAASRKKPAQIHSKEVLIGGVSVPRELLVAATQHCKKHMPRIIKSKDRTELLWCIRQGARRFFRRGNGRKAEKIALLTIKHFWTDQLQSDRKKIIAHYVLFNDLLAAIYRKRRQEAKKESKIWWEWLPYDKKADYYEKEASRWRKRAKKK
jgi:hypothetical protein